MLFLMLLSSTKRTPLLPIIHPLSLKQKPSLTSPCLPRQENATPPLLCFPSSCSAYKFNTPDNKISHHAEPNAISQWLPQRPLTGQSQVRRPELQQDLRKSTAQPAQTLLQQSQPLPRNAPPKATELPPGRVLTLRQQPAQQEHGFPHGTNRDGHPRHAPTE
jgi:hypothetical protein